jgi:hypothetical protein
LTLLGHRRFHQAFIRRRYAGPSFVTTPKFVNRSVYEGADHIALRLRSARKPAVIPFLEIPPEEIDLEPVTIEPLSLIDAELVSIHPLVVPVSDILPFDDEDEAVEIPAADIKTLPVSVSSVVAPSTPSSSPNASEELSLFGVGVIETKGSKGRSKKR